MKIINKLHITAVLLRRIRSDPDQNDRMIHHLLSFILECTSIGRESAMKTLTYGRFRHSNLSVPPINRLKYFRSHFVEFTNFSFLILLHAARCPYDSLNLRMKTWHGWSECNGMGLVSGLLQRQAQFLAEIQIIFETEDLEGSLKSLNCYVHIFKDLK